jgi:hypothetical protein
MAHNIPPIWRSKRHYETLISHLKYDKDFRNAKQAYKEYVSIGGRKTYRSIKPKEPVE